MADVMVTGAEAEPWVAELVDRTDLPGGGVLRLMRHGEDFAIMFGEEQLMGSWVGGSEEALAHIVCERLGNRAERLLIGGLGMGFTLAAALEASPDTTSIVVAELVPAVVQWAAGPLAHMFGDSLDDPRVTLDMRDVYEVIAEATERFDAILLDVDNGPDGVIHLANDRLYCAWGLREAYAALTPGGILAIWTAYASSAFVDRLKAAGFEVEEILMGADGVVGGDRHAIWLASKPATAFSEQT